MTPEQFDLHRPQLARGLRGMVDTTIEAIESVTPTYEPGLLFRARLRSTVHPDWLAAGYDLVCVAPDHPQSMCDGDPDCRGTWLFATDLRPVSG